MKLTIDQVEHIAALARLDLKSEEKELFLKQLSSVLEYVDQLGRIDTSAVEPMSHSVAMENVLRPDEVVPCADDAFRRLIEEFPDKDGGLLRVPAVFS